MRVLTACCGGQRTEFHEQAHSRGCPWAAISPEDDVVRVGVATGLKKVKEQVPRLDIYVTRVGPGCR